MAEDIFIIHLFAVICISTLLHEKSKPNRPVSQMWAPLAACREPEGSYDKTTQGALMFLNIKRHIY